MSHNERLNKLEEKFEEIYKSVHGIEPSEVDGLKGQIAELQKKVDYLEDRYKESGGLKCLRDRGLIKEALRKTLKKLADVGISGFIDEELLEKFDVGSARHTEKKKVVYKENTYNLNYKRGLEIIEKHKKASGGEKEAGSDLVDGVHSKREPKDISADSKPSESIEEDCTKCEHQNTKECAACLQIKGSPYNKFKEKLPEFVCSLELQGECGNEGSMDCLKGNSKGERFDTDVCVHGKRELEKPKEKTPEPIDPCISCSDKDICINECEISKEAKGRKEDFEKETETLGDLFTPMEKNELEKDPCGIEGKYEHWNREELENECNVLVQNIDALYVLHTKEKQERIEAFKDKLEFLRDKVLEVPILSGSVQDLRDHIHDLKDLVIKNINEYDGVLKT